MAWDGSGSFTRTNGTQTGATTWANARDAGNDILASQHDTHDQDLADGINACLTKNNESRPTATFKPNADAQYDLGSSVLRWVNLYLSGFVGDSSGNELLKFSVTSSAVNEVTIGNAATGTAPFLSATGETNVSIEIRPKGTGKARLTDGTDVTKKVAFDVSGVTTANTRTITVPDFDITLGITGLTEDTSPDLTADYVETYDASAGVLKKVLAGRIGTGTSATEQATSSGTAKDFTGIPAGVTEINIMLVSVRINGNTPIIFQIGDSGGIENADYAGSVGQVANGSTGAESPTSSWRTTSASSAALYHGCITLRLEDASDNTWVCTGILGRSDAATIDVIGGSKALSGTLDRVRITGGDGTSSFNAGVINLRYR